MIQGCELDYAIVIIGSEFDYDEERGRFVNTIAGDVDAVIYLQHLYFMLLSRGKRGLSIYFVNNGIREYFTQRVLYAKRRSDWIRQYVEQYSKAVEKKFLEEKETSSLDGIDFTYVPNATSKMEEVIAEVKGNLSESLDEREKESVLNALSAALLKLQNGIINNSTIVGKIKQGIIAHMGSNAWNKLDVLSKECLISAELTYNDLKDYNSLLDFSGVCVQATKAVECEMTKRYLTSYVEYLKNKYATEYIKRIPRSLMDPKNPDEVIKPNRFTLGDVRRKAVGLNYQGKVVDQYAYRQFSQYAKEELFTDTHAIDGVIKRHMQIIQVIKDKFRNRAAHKESMDVVSAKDCLDYIIEVQRELGRMLDDYKF